MKRILGLDLGTNSIGWALVEQNFDEKKGKILGMGSRIIPMDAGEMGKFAEGGVISKTAERTGYRSARKRYERSHLRRERLHRVLNILGFLPEHYANDIDFEKRFGKFKDEIETKLAWRPSGKKENGKDKFEFLFQKSFIEMVEDFKAYGRDLKIPYDLTIYYLRKKALTQKIEKKELAWLILNFNQKRGYYQLRGEEEDINENVKEFVIALTITKIEKGEVDKKNDKRTWYKLTLSNGWEYSATFTTEPNWLNAEKEFLVVEEYDDNGKIKIIKDKKTDTTGREKRRISILPTFEEIDLMAKKDQDKIYGKIKTRTEVTISNSGTTVGEYIYNTLLKNPKQKIRGKLVRTIERKFYKDELKQILEKQIALQPELFTEDLYNACVRELYKSNDVHQQQLSAKNSFVHLFLNDIIFYQRPLKSRKSSIGNCSLEFRLHKINKKDDKGNPIKDSYEKDINGKDVEVKDYLKAIPKSNPYYQEFRVWQWLYNLKIYTKKDDADVTEQFIESVEDLEKLFEFLMSKKEVNHLDILTHFIEPIVREKFPSAKSKAFKTELTKEIAKYRWNYVFDDSKDKEEDKSKRYPMNETGYEIRRRIEKVENVSANFLTREIEQQLWHIIYSVSDPKEFEKAIEKFAVKHHLNTISFVENFKNFKPFKSDYGQYSEKALKKILSLMRVGKYWKWEAIDSKTQARIDKLLTGEFDEEIQNRVREKAVNLTEQNHFQGLQLWLAQYVVYDRHSEASDIGKWSSVESLEKYLEEFKQHSLGNPIVEQVITETLRVVKDIWKHYGKGTENFFSEIHVELGREMKNTADERKRLTSIVSDNESTNLRIKSMLLEFENDDYFKNQENYKNDKGETPDLYSKGNNPVRAYSPSHQEILKIYEDGALSKYSEIELKNENFKNAGREEAKNVYEVSRKANPTKAEITRYKLWLEQKYQSPYTGQMIPLSKLFTPAYEIEHIIPQSRYFDDSLSNKVICETEVNKLKDNQLGLEFIKNHFGQKVTIEGNREVPIFTEEQYKSFIDEHYAKNKAKRTKLLLEEIPDKMIARQMNDTRYISKFVSQVLSNIVRADKDDDGINSKNLIPGNGKITSTLKQDWGLNNVWNVLILPRFERMNILTNTTDFTATNKEGHAIPAIPLELSKGFQKKRIDHRHHALDALVIACATRSHVNYLNNTSAKAEDLINEERKKKQLEQRNKLKNSLCFKTKPDEKGNYKWVFKKPWENFTVDAKNELERIVVSFKQNLRVINKATNKYEKIENGKKVLVEQKGLNWAIRKPMHKETVSGLVNLPRIKVPKGKIITATRKSLDTSFNSNSIENITDTGIQKILINHLETYDEPKIEIEGKDISDRILKRKELIKKKELVEHPELAFSPEGVEEMNKNIRKLNDGKAHYSIFKVRTFELGSKFQVGQTGNKKAKYVEAAKGTNLFFAVYWDEKKQKRGYETISLNEVIERQKQGLSSAPETNGKGDQFLFHLSPNDLVYVPTLDELQNNINIDFGNLTKEQVDRIYKMVSSTGSECHFVRIDIASLIKSYDAKSKIGELGSLNKLETTMDISERIKEVCIKLKVDRLGNISKA
ncbi:type II CRISPR RNA-guided endonuclease Cas9 [Belliella kenyensis]|uniref:CRISPR-associated endonuclease Cas9 n=1 Tax=Belliella kenyensis TaxID=1472724 RepID=A0ABV8EMH0_9BACT|nr:type II CRISPR RNA-guided endonuclease Cas9 [Belliella kenyensis]MCH7400293.1 type II CRISPR RNA-guided endonuclease Cas9 [Belliella kenyensis]MDN3604689.1 HNH endonuclease domain-containing protein [Belliella kenyensis]MDN3605273.1 HNH endonuclease domain-containing protein [Belliella kenyensis]